MNLENMSTIGAACSNKCWESTELFLFFFKEKKNQYFPNILNGFFKNATTFE